MPLRMPVVDLAGSYHELLPTLEEMQQIVLATPPERARYAKHLNRPGVIFQYLYYSSLVQQALPSKAVICDWGGQYGHVTKLLRHHFPEVVCYLPDAEEFEARYYHKQFGVEDVVAFGPGYGDAHIPFADNSFDAVMSSGVLEHTREYGVTEAESLQEIHRVLRPNGMLFIWNLPRRWGSVELVNLVLRRSVHKYKYTKQLISGLLQEAGFSIELFDQHELLNLSSRNLLGQVTGHVRAWTLDYYLSKLVLFGAFAQHFTIIARKCDAPNS